MNLMNKNKGIDIFKSLANSIMKGDSQQNTVSDVKHQMNINYKTALANKLAMIINLKMIHGYHYLKTCLIKK